MAENRRHLPEQDYEDPNNISTYDFIYFVQDYRPFLLSYINDKYRDDPDEVGYLTSFIDVCEGINTTAEDDGSFEQYRPTIEPLMEWVTLWAQSMNEFYAQQQQEQPGGPTGVASRTRSKHPSSVFEIPPNKKGTDTFTFAPTRQEGVRITLSDGKEYTYPEIKNMWNWNKTITPRRHSYTEEDKNKIAQLIEFATKGGKKTRKNKRNSKKTRKVRKNKSKKVRKNKRTKTRR
uniref:Uncharacterized protein n=1 Tax=viral metagenome TaxID=1070528 RepID=A0A6C0K3X9_9ZZZZ